MADTASVQLVWLSKAFIFDGMLLRALFFPLFCFPPVFHLPVRDLAPVCIEFEVRAVVRVVAHDARPRAAALGFGVFWILDMGQGRAMAALAAHPCKMRRLLDRAETLGARKSDHMAADTIRV